MQSGEVKHSLVQSSAVLSGPFQLSGAHYNPVPSTQVKSYTHKEIAVYFHPEQPKSLNANWNSPV